MEVDDKGGIGSAAFDAATSFSGTHMDDLKTPQFALNSLKTAAGLTMTVVGATTTMAPGIGTGVGMGVNAVLGSIMDGVEAFDTQKVIAGLKEQRDLAGALNGQPGQDLTAAIDLAIKKKTRHRDIAISDAATLQVGKLGTLAYRGTRALHKARTGTKGVSRENAANKLIEYAKRNETARGTPGGIAKAVIALVSKQNFEEILKNSVAESLRS